MKKRNKQSNNSIDRREFIGKSGLLTGALFLPNIFFANAGDHRLFRDYSINNLPIFQEGSMTTSHFGNFGFLWMNCSLFFISFLDKRTPF